ncbi:hypothetical protein Vretimale_9811 [Volvox reticuliferus]|uniref:Uncharacterized protein n=1 Tax=Volvox reticuliferus TaxID=1737510 RepID=A0A8J4GE17_9CHLO|nr:hypothetical protein Vretimale_9811 [Volvox reticuliferus]
MAPRDLHKLLACMSLLILESFLKASAMTTPLTDFMLSKSITNHGDLAMYSRVFNKLKDKSCLNIIAIAIDALGPFPTTELQAWFNETWYQGDNVHPNPDGHALLADLVFHYLRTAYEHTRLFQWYDLPQDYILRQPLFVNQDILDLYLDKKPATITLTNMNYVKVRALGPCRGWRAYADVPEKSGFIAMDVGSSCVLALRPEEINELGLGKAHVLMYKSYENMGIFKMTITEGQVKVINGTCEGADDPNARVLGSMTVDSLWAEKASLAEVAIMQFELPPASDTSACLLVHLAVVEANPARLSNKVKLLGISFF